MMKVGAKEHKNDAIRHLIVMFLAVLCKHIALSNSNYESASHIDEYRRVVHETLAVCRDLRSLNETRRSCLNLELLAWFRLPTQHLDNFRQSMPDNVRQTSCVKRHIVAKGLLLTFDVLRLTGKLSRSF